MYIFGGCSDSVTIDGGVQAVKGVKMEIGVAVSQGMSALLNRSLLCGICQYIKIKSHHDMDSRWSSLESFGGSRAIRISGFARENIR